ncbi:YVTN family beta-propeller protein [Variovorax boronicumulans]|uniref:YVTN family beta-propeller protein n=1 Tax=Variovorax boronicumulans TaxID=436515 RepID=A0AAW8CYF1_9BURK|nr:YncE family protein [Variovorax boronicumulans]MDP9893249.1 YVTN family beta-propeller protein [Variovorax boronicumulans]MDQ0052407.1 YVTN family beta-propeller protein [Variovorax boronicumulans]
MRLPACPNGRVAAFLFSCLTALVAHAAIAAPAEPPPIFVLNSLDANVSVINPADWTEKLRIPTGKEPHHIYMTPDEKSVIVANSAGDSLTFLNPKTAEVQRVVYGIIDPYQLQFSRDMKWFVTAGNRLNHVDVYRWDGKDLKLAKRIASGKTPSHIWIDNTSTIAYVTMQDSDEMIAIDLPTQTIRWRVATGAMPADIYGIHNDKTLLVGLTGSDGVQVFDVAGTEPKLVGKIPTGKGAHAFRSAGDGKSVFVSNRVANTISRIDIATLKVSATYAVPGGPDCMDVSADGKTLYVTSRWAKKLSVIDLATQKVVRQVNVGRSPHGVWTLDHAKRI